jgi:nucleoside-diphosphate-sugar epimerase
VGSHLVEALLRRGWAIAALARSGPGRHALEGLGCRVVEGDLHDAAALSDLVAGARLVFHVAGLVAARSEAEFRRVNAEGSATLAHAASAARVGRLIHVSSLAATGPTVPGRPLDEHAAPRPLTAYGRSKLQGEDAVRRSGVPFTIVRPPVVYGPRDRQLLRVFRLVRCGILPVLPNDAQELSLVYAGDLADALTAAATSAACEGRTYHAVHPEIVTQRQLGEAIARAVGRRVLPVRIPALAVRAVLGLTGGVARLLGRSTLLSAEKARELLAPAWTARGDSLSRDAGWSAATALDRGLATTARWYREAGWL